MKALVVDGYNAIHKIPRLRALLDQDLRAARMALTELALEYQRKTGGVAEVKVVFDGKDAYRDHSLLAGPHQVFSQTGDGDRTIIRTVQRLSHRYQTVVVSDDNFVRNNARAHNAAVLSISKFISAIEKTGSKKRGALREEKMIEPKDAEDITAYVKGSLRSKGVL